MNVYDNIWIYSKFYADMVATANRLFENDEPYASLVVLFNATELIFKSIRENDSYTLSNDIEWLHRHDFLSTDEFEFLNDETGIRTLRNKMVHKDFYRYFIEIDGILYPFTEKETWNMLCEMIIPETLSIINNVISKKMDIASMGEE